ncbi:hypothetical protein COLO4_00241 [Corchorus olitorius]|uniref:Uncharacterized protein n=1 Tax=Corchorus olitorius TaxID=93759 RepID=A0A1R3L4B0_9ROSI|nr:hypothetical protein COLO4_00241 [Corchorus olitorius]
MAPVLKFKNLDFKAPGTCKPINDLEVVVELN